MSVAKRINSAVKGSGGEREFARAVFDHLGVELVRNLEARRVGGHDLLVNGDGPIAVSLDRFALEIKRYAEITDAMMVRFWTQATEQADRVGKIPALAVRQDRQQWRVSIPLPCLAPDVFHPSWGGFEWTATMSIEGFCTLVREGA